MSNSNSWIFQIVSQVRSELSEYDGLGSEPGGRWKIDENFSSTFVLGECQLTPILYGRKIYFIEEPKNSRKNAELGENKNLFEHQKIIKFSNKNQAVTIIKS